MGEKRDNKEQKKTKEGKGHDRGGKTEKIVKWAKASNKIVAGSLKVSETLRSKASHDVKVKTIF